MNRFVSVLRLIAAVFVFLALTGSFCMAGGDDPMEFWSRSRHGANGGVKQDDRAHFEAAHEAGIEFIRLSLNALSVDKHDFLVGDADNFQGIAEADFKRLVEALDAAEAAGVKVVLTTSTLPGHRWRQHNGGKDDRRLWTDAAFTEQSAAFWSELSRRLNGHPAVVGFNILNEPHPERLIGMEDLRWGPRVEEWYKEIEGTAADLNTFNRRMVAAIRPPAGVDARTPIIIDSGLYADPRAFANLRPIDDERVLYSFHMYEPYLFTNKQENQERFTYPGVIDTPGAPEGRCVWNRAEIARFLAPVAAWQTAHHVASTRILAGEFGVNRQVGGAAEYLRDVIDVCEEHGWHWAFYCFREESWPGMDYELGARGLSGEVWDAIDRGERVDLPRGMNPIWQVIVDGLRRGR